MARETPVPQPPQIPEPDDGLTAAEREYFKTGGTASDALLAENVDYKPPAVDPNAPPAPATPGAHTPPATPGAQPPPAAIAGEEFDTDDDSPAAAAAKAAGKTPKRVNYNKFARTEAELTATKAELAKAKETSTRIDERMKLINEALATTPAQQQAAEEQDPAPDPEKDIFGYVRWQGRQMEKLTGQLDEVRQGRAADNDGVELSNWYKDQAVSYAREDETFLGTGTKETSAYTYLIQSRLGELASMGVAEQEAKRIVLGEERAIVEKARKDGVSPAKIITTLAAGRGFNKEAATAAIAKLRNPTPVPAAPVPAAPGTPLGGTPANQNPTNGTQAAPAVPATPNVAAEIAAIKNAQPSALSLSGGGGVPADPLTPQMLADMPEDEFAAVLARLSPTRQRELFGT